MVDHNFFMKEALSVAAQAMEEGELPIGAVIVVNDQIIARSSTKEKSLGRWLVHAELLALESPGDGATELLSQWARKNQDMPSCQAPSVQGGILRNESIDLFKRYSEKYNSGGLWEWAKTLAAL